MYCLSSVRALVGGFRRYDGVYVPIRGAALLFLLTVCLLTYVFYFGRCAGNLCPFQWLDSLTQDNSCSSWTPPVSSHQYVDP